MNEKLFDKALKLSKQASDWVDETYPDVGYEPRAWQNHYRTKFAELIIKECINVCRGTKVSTAQYNSGRLDCSVDIKNHFGIQ